MYKIVMDGNTIYYPGDEKVALISSTLNLELNTAGTLIFICPPKNPYYETEDLLSVYIEMKKKYLSVK